MQMQTQQRPCHSALRAMIRKATCFLLSNCAEALPRRFARYDTEGYLLPLIKLPTEQREQMKHKYEDAWPLMYLQGVSDAWVRLTQPFAASGTHDLLGGRRFLVDGKDLGVFPHAPNSKNASCQESEPGRVDLAELLSLCLPSSDGHMEIDGSRIHIADTLPANLYSRTFDDDLISAADDLVYNTSHWLSVQPSLRRLVVYEDRDRGRPASHATHYEGTSCICDLQSADSDFEQYQYVANLVVIANFAHTGGAFKVSMDNEVSFIEEEERWIAFFKDCNYEVSPVLEGARVALEFSLSTKFTLPKEVKGIRYDDVYEPGMLSADIFVDASRLDLRLSGWSCTYYCYNEDEIKELEAYEDRTQVPCGESIEEDKDEIWREQRACEQTPSILDMLHGALHHLLRHGSPSMRLVSSPNPPPAIGLLLRHRYYPFDKCVSPQDLQGADSIAYHSLLEDFEVSIVPLYIYIRTNHSWYAQYIGVGAPMEYPALYLGHKIPLLSPAKSFPLPLLDHYQRVSRGGYEYRMYNNTYAGCCLVVSLKQSS